MVCLHTAETLMSMKGRYEGVHLLSVFHKLVIKQTKVHSLTYKLLLHKQLMLGNYTAR